MSENTEKKMSLQEAVDNIKAYKQCIDTALEIGHGTAASAKFSEALDVVLDRLDKLYAYMLANSRFDNPTPTPIDESDLG